VKILIPALAALLLMPAFAAGSGVSVETLAEGSTSWDGGAFSYPEGTPRITVVRIQVPAGEGFPWHCHPMPLAGAITRGCWK
jgi:quercetin dioxygenase-like cupin family protein